MKTYYVIKHDAAHLPRVRGCAVGTDPELFRKIPLEAMIWSTKVRATNEVNAVNIAIELKQ